MAVRQLQSSASEEQVRSAIERAMTEQGGTTVENRPGSLSMDLGGSVGKAYLAGGFRNRMKMPMRLVVTTAAGDAGTGVTIDVRGRGTGSGAMSGGLLGVMKQRKAEQAWLDLAADAVGGLQATRPPA